MARTPDSRAAQRPPSKTLSATAIQKTALDRKGHVKAPRPYRPNQTPTQPGSTQLPDAGLVQPFSRALQTKNILHPGRGLVAAATQQAAPPVYRPAGTNGKPLMSGSRAGTSPGPPPVYRPKQNDSRRTITPSSAQSHLLTVTPALIRTQAVPMLIVHPVVADQRSVGIGKRAPIQRTIENRVPTGVVHWGGSIQRSLRTSGGAATSAAPVEDPVFTDSESDSEDPAHQGLRLTKKKADKAEFDRWRFTRHKLYEDKLAEFDQSKTPQEHLKPIETLIDLWIEKQVIGKVTQKIRAINDIDDESGIREIPSTADLDAQGLLEWLRTARRIKIVVSSKIPHFEGRLEAAIKKLRVQFPDWQITAKMGDPKARVDHDRMHKRD
jgi:hypothetical protein